MRIEIFIALIFLVFIAAGDFIAIIGWMWSDVRTKNAVDKLRRVCREKRHLLAENKQLKAKVSFYENLKECENCGCNSATD